MAEVLEDTALNACLTCVKYFGRMKRGQTKGRGLYIVSRRLKMYELYRERIVL